MGNRIIEGILVSDRLMLQTLKNYLSKKQFLCQIILHTILTFFGTSNQEHIRTATRLQIYPRSSI
ncbi:hypothetical protein JY97_05545 [Alkalispirochaeta odontotermitis]|nr:hypothetical protein JY97_05545 [Alkalispirochaeta odontotermitis]